MIDAALSHPYVGMIVSIAAYGAGAWVKAKTKSPLANPLLVSSVLVIAAIHVSPLTLAQYRNGGEVITMLIVPATVVLAIQIDRQWSVLRANAAPILVGCVVGSLVSMASIWVLCRWFGIEDTVTLSLLPKSVTTAISIELSEKSGGLPSLTVSAVILTGMTSAVFSPLAMRFAGLKNPVGAGVAMGVSGHAVGTATALEMGEAEGAFAGIALGLAGVATSVFYTLGMRFL